MTSIPYDAIILGAGGAGLICAATAGRRGKTVLLLDHAAEPGKKILISGGGRCNFTNVNATAEHAQTRYISANPHFAKSALGRFTPQDFIDLVDEHGIAWHEKTLGQLFCDGSARQIVEMLVAECHKASANGGSVRLVLHAAIGEVCHDGTQFLVTYSGGVARARALVVATGGPSIPKMGATGFAYDLGRQFGLKVVEPRPALVPFTLGGDDILFRELSGVSADVIASAGKVAFREAALLTHKGLSGPAILQISSYWRHGDAVEINFLPDQPRAWLRTLKREKPRIGIKSALGASLSGRLADMLADRLTDDRNLADFSDQALQLFEEQLAGWTFHPNGTEGYAKAEVTSGGISTDGLSQKTMEAKRVPGLHFIGEAVDVTGWLGGYNFQWAWASGVAAGEVL